MSSLKDKFDDFREEPRYGTWERLLKRLNNEMPVRTSRKFLLWLIPVFFAGTITAWLMYPAARSNYANNENDNKVSTVNNSVVTSKDSSPKSREAMNPIITNNPEINSPAPQTKNQAHEPSITLNQDIPSVVQHSNPNNSGGDISLPSSDIRNISPKIKNPDLDLLDTKSVEIPNTILNNSLGASIIRNPVIKPTDNIMGDKFILEIYFGGGGSNILLREPVRDLISRKEMQSNKTLRNKISSSGISYTTGFGLKMDLDPNFRVKTGFYITQISQTLYYNTKESNCGCGQAISLSQIDGNLKESDMVGQNDTISIGNSNSFTNKYSLREIPLIFEYMVPMAKHKNFSTVLSFGGSYMFMRGINSRMPDADNVGFISIVNKTSTPTIFPSYSNAFNAILGLGIVYRAPYNVEWSLAPVFKMAVTSLSKNERWLREYPWQAQLAIGVGKRF